MVLKKRSSAYFEDATCILTALYLHTNEAMLDFGRNLARDLFWTQFLVRFVNIKTCCTTHLYLHSYKHWIQWACLVMWKSAQPFRSWNFASTLPAFLSFLKWFWATVIQAFWRWFTCLSLDISWFYIQSLYLTNFNRMFLCLLSHSTLNWINLATNQFKLHVFLLALCCKTHHLFPFVWMKL